MHRAVALERTTESLLQAKRPRLRSFNTRGPCARDVQALDDASEELDHRAEEPGISGQPATHGKRHRQHPLPHRPVRQDLSDDVQRPGGHAPSAARRADSATFARGCEQHVLAAPPTSQPCQAPSQKAATMKSSQLQLDVPGQRPLVVVPGVPQGACQISAALQWQGSAGMFRGRRFAPAASLPMEMARFFIAVTPRPADVVAEPGTPCFRFDDGTMASLVPGTLPTGGLAAISRS